MFVFPVILLFCLSGAVSVSGELDYETQKSFLFRVVAEDGGQPPLSSSTFLRINILNVNDNAPVFDKPSYGFIVGDFIKPGQFIGKVSCVDPDNEKKSRLRYSITDSKLANVGTYTGLVTLNRRPMRGSNAQFEIHCTDGKHFSSVDVILTPEEANEYRPAFPNREFPISVQENISPTFLTVVTATDTDQGSFGTVTYSIDGNILSKKFTVNPTTGDIFSKVSLDRETEKDGRIVLPVRASDGGGRFDVCKVTITIVDANDNDPVFEFPSYEATVSTATPMSSVVLTVKAVDLDSGKNGEIMYSISGLE